MKTIDFSFTGGYPLGEDDLQWMQDNSTDILRALAGIGNADNYIINGVAVSGDDPTFTFTPGWIYFRGDIYYCPGGDADGSNHDSIGFVITELDDASRTLVYSDGVSRMPISNKVAVPVHWAIAEDDTHIRYSYLKRGMVPYPVAPDPIYETFASGGGTAATTAIVDTTVSVQTFVRARKEIASGLITVGIQVKVLDSGAIGVSPPSRRAVNTGIDLPWHVMGCGSTGQLAYPIPLLQNISSAAWTPLNDSAGKPLEYVWAQVYDRRLWLQITKTGGGYTTYWAGGGFMTLEQGRW